MTVLCPKCRKALRVPPGKEGVPGLKARCSGCSTVFVVAEASLALAATPAVPEAPPATEGPRAPGLFRPRRDRAGPARSPHNAADATRGRERLAPLRQPCFGS